MLKMSDTIREAGVILAAMVCGILLGAATGWVFGLTAGTIILASGVLLLLRAIAR